MKFLKSLDSYREYGKLKNYLYVVAKNTIRDFQRKKYEITEEPGVEASCDGALDNIPLQIDIWREIQILDPLDKELIILRYYQNFKVKDIAQIVNIKRDNDIAENKALNIVYMGMGEPLDNFDNFTKAVEIFSELDGLAISRRRQTVSTSGIATKIKKLGEKDLQIQLAISLHAVDDELRSELIPMNKAYNIASIIEAVKAFPVDTRKKVMFEYLVIKDKNDSIEAAKKLVSLLNGIQAKVNLIYFNPYPGTSYQRPQEKDMLKFKDFLNQKGVICTIRESKGLDISAKGF